LSQPKIPPPSTESTGTSAVQSLSLLLVFYLSTKCNLECSYCNVDAGPRGYRPVLDPHIFEKWLEAFASLEPSEISLQLHGGEPLMVDPPVELFAAIAMNMLARYPGTKLGKLAIQSNGLTLDESRLDSLATAGVRVNISIDGPAEIHDHHRVTATGRGSHRDALRAHHRLRARGKNTAVITVVTDPQDVIPAVKFFLDEGFCEARMNPLRPEGRAVSLRNWDDTTFMREMAGQYFRAAQLIAAHNRRFPQAPFVELNMASLMESMIDPNGAARVNWTFVVDDHGNLWAHPGGYGIDAMRLSRDEVPNADILRRTLGLDSFAGLSTGVLMRAFQKFRPGLFTPCAECRSPDVCVPVYGPKSSTEMTRPMCIWRRELTNHLEGWLREAPETASQITRCDRVGCLT
jgi:sulfatase maturation enzyme AslB (radical SAM superfamily)